MSLPRAAILAGVALAVTLLNAVKPLALDDPVYFAYSAHIARHPLDPYGFTLLGHRPANETLAPPVLPYWWAGAIRLFGDRPFLWKLSLLPFGLLLVFALHALLRRFARGLELPLVLFTAGSPALLPGWNFMLDLPALALGLAAVGVYLRGWDRSSPGLAALAGLVAGLAVQTKYTAFVAVAAVLLHAALFGRRRLGLATAGLAVLVFAAWEGYVARVYGESHFLLHCRQHPAALLAKLHLVLPALTTLGGVGSAGGLLALAVLGAPGRGVAAAGGALALAYGLVAAVPESGQTLVRAWPGGPSRLDLPGLLFGAGGLLVSASALLVVVRLARHAWRRGGWPVPGRVRREEWFLIGWLGLEVAGYFALSPFPAARRVIGVVVAGTLLAGRLPSRTCRAPGRARLLWCCVVASVLLGLGFAGLDLWEARVQQRAARQAARWVREHDPGARAWFRGVHGLLYHAERAGLRLLRPERVRPGDWVVVVSGVGPEGPGGPPEKGFQQRLALADSIPLRTYCCYYGSGTPLEHQEGPRAVVALYRRPGQ